MKKMPEVILLCGFSGSGKTETGIILAKNIGYGFTDTDEAVEEILGRTIPEIFAQMGESEFRSAESDALRAAVMRKPQIISLGGGSIDDENNLEYIKRNGCLVYLKTTPETVHRRLRDSHVRPMLQSFGLSEGKKAAPALERICSLMEKREKYYLQADIVIDTEGRTPDEAAREIKSRLIQDGP